MLQVKYSDRFVEELHLPVEKLDFGPTKPTISFDPADCGFSELVRLLGQWPCAEAVILQDPLVRNFGAGSRL